MTQFQRKPVVIEAVQWHKPGDHPAVEAREPHLLFDRAGNYFYVARFDDQMMRGGCWMAVDPEGQYAKEHGELLPFAPFAFYSVKSGEQKPIAERRDLYDRYAAMAKYTREPQASGFVVGPAGKLHVLPGSWIIGDPEGATFTVLKDEAFKAEYEPVSE